MTTPPNREALRAENELSAAEAKRIEWCAQVHVDGELTCRASTYDLSRALLRMRRFYDHDIATMQMRVDHARSELAKTKSELERVEAELRAGNAAVERDRVEHVELNGHIDIAQQCVDWLASDLAVHGDQSGRLRDFVESLRIVIDQLDKQRRACNWYEASTRAGKDKLIESAVARVAAQRDAVLDRAEKAEAELGLPARWNALRLVKEAEAQRDAALARADAAERERDEALDHIAKNFPARGSTLGDLTVTEERLHDLAEDILAIKLNLSDPETRAVWEAAQSAKREVESWPEWKRAQDERERGDFHKANTAAEISRGERLERERDAALAAKNGGG